MALTNKLTAIADAIRTKGGTTALLKLDDMPAAIEALSGAGGGSGEDLVPNPYNITVNGKYYFYNGRLDWLLENYMDRISINELGDAEYMFSWCNSKKTIPVPINIITACSCAHMFASSSIPLTEENFSGMNGKIGAGNKMFSAYSGETLPTITATTGSGNGYAYSRMFANSTVKSIGAITLRPSEYSAFFSMCEYLQHCPELSLLEGRAHTYQYVNCNSFFENCKSMRTVSANSLSYIYNTACGANYSPYKNMFCGCYVLDEINGISTKSGALTTNAFYDTFANCHRLKGITFETQEDGTPYTVQWKAQTISLYDAVGWSKIEDKYITTEYNSGITVDKKVSDVLTYNALKDDPDWYSSDPQFSRFNHDSAVALINSLPDTSAYLAANTGSTNTVYLRNNAGLYTDGGSCGSLTEEEIAVATAKGWTITYKT